jgi:hypothetical protein
MFANNLMSARQIRAGGMYRQRGTPSLVKCREEIQRSSRNLKLPGRVS